MNKNLKVLCCLSMFSTIISSQALHITDRFEEVKEEVKTEQPNQSSNESSSNQIVEKKYKIVKKETKDYLNFKKEILESKELNTQAITEHGCFIAPNVLIRRIDGKLKVGQKLTIHDEKLTIIKIVDYPLYNPLAAFSRHLYKTSNYRMQLVFFNKPNKYFAYVNRGRFARNNQFEGFVVGIEPKYKIEARGNQGVNILGNQNQKTIIGSELVVGKNTFELDQSVHQYIAGYNGKEKLRALMNKDSDAGSAIFYQNKENKHFYLFGFLDRTSSKNINLEFKDKKKWRSLDMFVNPFDVLTNHWIDTTLANNLLNPDKKNLLSFENQISKEKDLKGYYDLLKKHYMTNPMQCKQLLPVDSYNPEVKKDFKKKYLVLAPQNCHSIKQYEAKPFRLRQIIAGHVCLTDLPEKLDKTEYAFTTQLGDSIEIVNQEGSWYVRYDEPSTGGYDFALEVQGNLKKSTVKISRFVKTDKGTLAIIEKPINSQLIGLSLKISQTPTKKKTKPPMKRINKKKTKRKINLK